MILTALKRRLHWVVVAWLAIGSFGCATTKIDWNSRIGHYTHDQAILEMGPPDKSAQLTDGSRVAEWLTHRGHRHGSMFLFRGGWVQHYSEPPGPDYYLRLTFGPDGQLLRWNRVMK